MMGWSCGGSGNVAKRDVLDALFEGAVSAIDAGDVAALERQLAEQPRLVRERLKAPGAWLRDKVGSALDGFFQRPYLLWFVAEDPFRNGKLPSNIGRVAETIIAAARGAGAANLQEQLNYALRLVCWSWIARQCGVQIDLIDVLVDAGASVDGTQVYDGRYGTHSDAAIYNGNYAAAQRLIERGAEVTLTTALCLERWDDLERLLPGATLAEKQDAFVQAAMNGRADALRRMLAAGVDATTVSDRNQSHGTALHHAVWSSSLDAVKVLMEAGADLTKRDAIYDGTPLGWALYGQSQAKDEPRAKRYSEIAQYLRVHGGRD
jgi:peptide-methionine (S)-S-oxide reductase